MRNSKEVVDYLNKLRNQQQVSISELARRVHMSKSTVSLYFNKTREFPVNRLDEFAKALHTTPEKVLGVEEASDGSKPNNVVSLSSKGFHRVSIPIIGTIACGDPITAEENIDGYTEQVFTGAVPSGTLFALRCKGQSMEPTIPDGSLVTIHEQPEVEDGQIAAVLVNDDTEATLKRVKRAGDTVILLPDNNDFQPIILDEKHPGRIIGKAIQVVTEL